MSFKDTVIKKMKTNQCYCCFCNREIYPYDEFEASKTKRGTLNIAHKECVKIYRVLDII